METGAISYSEFATDPRRSTLGRLGAVFRPKITDSAKVSVARLAGRPLALAETPIQVEFDHNAGLARYLLLRGPADGPDDDGPSPVRLRAKPGPTTLSPATTGSATTTCMPVEADGSVRRIASLPVQEARLHAQLWHEPKLSHPDRVPSGCQFAQPLALAAPYIENFRWEPRRGTPFWVVNRHTGELVGRYDCDPFFAFHHVNAFERGRRTGRRPGGL
jgi:beta,beta-carotene 9',10'-dioxygenase